MTFRDWLTRQVELDSEHARFACQALSDHDFRPRRFASAAIQLGEREACDHAFTAFQDAWDAWTREGHAPPADADDCMMR